MAPPYIRPLIDKCYEKGVPVIYTNGCAAQQQLGQRLEFQRLCHRLRHRQDLTRQGVRVDRTILTDLEDAVEHVIPRVSLLSKKKQHLIEKPQGPC
jgi:hypothetical protein